MRDFWKDLCKRDDFLREVIGAIQLRCTALPRLRARHERRAMTGWPRSEMMVWRIAVDGDSQGVKDKVNWIQRKIRRMSNWDN